MLNISKGVVNILYVTVTEKTTISNPYYLFVFKHGITAVQRTFILTDVSAFPNRYNQFSFTEGSGQKLLDAGLHYYTIYAQSSSANLIPEDADEEVEIGVAYVSESTTSNTQHDPTVEYKQHNI